MREKGRPRRGNETHAPFANCRKECGTPNSTASTEGHRNFKPETKWSATRHGNSQRETKARPRAKIEQNKCNGESYPLHDADSTRLSERSHADVDFIGK